MIKNLTTRRLAGAAFAALATLALSIGAADARTRADGDTSRVGIKKIIVQEALASRVPPSLALAVAKVESDFQSNALSSKGARGVMQIMPETAAGEWGVEADELWDPRLNIRLGIDFLERLIERYDGNWEYALSYYNGGSAVGKPGQARVLPWTRGYVDNVLRWERRYAAQKRIWMALVKREDRAYGGPKVRRWLPREGRIDVASTTPEIARNDDMVKAGDTRQAKKRTIRPRVRWTPAPSKRHAKSRSARRVSKHRVKLDGIDDIESRRRAIRGTLDDFTPRLSEDG